MDVLSNQHFQRILQDNKEILGTCGVSWCNLIININWIFLLTCHWILLIGIKRIESCQRWMIGNIMHYLWCVSNWFQIQNTAVKYLQFPGYLLSIFAIKFKVESLKLHNLKGGSIKKRSKFCLRQLEKHFMVWCKGNMIYLQYVSILKISFNNLLDVFIRCKMKISTNL